MAALGLFLGALALAIAGLRARAAANEVRANRTFPPVGKIITLGGRKMHVLDQGKGPGVLMIHGASGNVRDLDLALGRNLAERYRVIAADRPGLGHSDTLHDHGESMAEQAAQLAAMLDALEIGPVIALGYSYGGAVALSLALSHPDKVAGIVMASGVSNTWDTPLGWQYRVTASALIGAAFRTLVVAFPPRPIIRRNLAEIFAPQMPPPGYADAIGVALTVRRATLKANARQVRALLGQVREMVPRYNEIAVPVEILHGDADTVVGADIHSRILATQIKGARLTILPGVGHAPHHAVPETIIAAIDRVADASRLPHARATR